MGDLSASTRALALAARLVDEADPNATRTAVRRAMVSDITASALAISPRERWITIGASLVADLGPTILGCEETVGAGLTADLLDTLGADDAEVFSRIGEVVRHRFERVDGRGEPSGLTENQIPRPARLLAIADVLVDAWSDQPIPWERRRELVKDQAGTNLDLELADACLRSLRHESARRITEMARLDDILTMLRRLAVLAEADQAIPATPETVADIAARMAAVIEKAMEIDGLAITCGHPATARLHTLVRTGTARRLPDASLEPAALGQGASGAGDAVTLTRQGIGSVAVSPITRSGTRIGLLIALRTDESAPFDSWEQRLIGSAAGAIGLTAEWELSQTRLHRLAHTDPLTGVANRWVLEERLHALYQRPTVDRADAALVMADVDHLKAVNDQAGHGAGDALLRRVGCLLVESVAHLPATLVCRLGGDEFCILMETGGLLSADAVVTAIEAAAAAEGIGISAGTGYAVQCTSPAALLSEADAAQYEIKRRRTGTPIGTTSAPHPGRRVHRDR